MNINPTKYALIIDDDEMFCEYIGIILESIRYSVRKAFDGAQGVQLFKQHRFDLVVTDFDMPIMNGLDMVAQIRTERRGPETTVLLLTGHDDSTLVERARALGVVRVMRKPVTVGGLLAAVRDLAA